MIDTTTIIFVITTLCGIGWRFITKWDLLDTVDLGNEKINAIVRASRAEAVATDYYIRSMADGKLTIEEGEQFKTYAASAIISHLTTIEEITGKQVYNRPEVPLPLPVGGKRVDSAAVMMAAEVPTPEQLVQVVSPIEGA